MQCKSSNVMSVIYSTLVINSYRSWAQSCDFFLSFYMLLVWTGQTGHPGAPGGQYAKKKSDLYLKKYLLMLTEWAKQNSCNQHLYGTPSRTIFVLVLLYMKMG